jgi:hypothetical protein
VVPEVASRWKLPTYNTVLYILGNTFDVGAYAFGRTETRVRIEGGRKRPMRANSSLE